MSIVSPLGYAAICAGRELGIPTIVTFHSVLGATAHVLSLIQQLTGWLKSQLLVVSAVSERVASELRCALPGINVLSLPNGVYPEFWRGPRNAPKDRVVIATAMRLNRRKRPLALLRAFQRAQSIATGRRLTLQIAGAGPEQNKLQRYIARYKLMDVTLHGVQSQEALRRLYTMTHLFVLPSIREAFGIAALEARCASLPVIAMRAAGCSEFLAATDQSQVLVDNDEELAVQIARLATEDTLREQLGKIDAGLARFAWPNVADAHMALYSQIASVAA
jgi:glycosyltransferase involved in cell wall biosynthesis